MCIGFPECSGQDSCSTGAAVSCWLPHRPTDTTDSQQTRTSCSHGTSTSHTAGMDQKTGIVYMIRLMAGLYIYFSPPPNIILLINSIHTQGFIQRMGILEFPPPPENLKICTISYWKQNFYILILMHDAVTVPPKLLPTTKKILYETLLQFQSP